MTYAIVVHRRAQKEAQKLPAKERARIAEMIASLRIDPFRGKQLQGGFAGKWVMRVWPYRIVYEIDRKIVTVTVLRIAHRQGAYKK